MGKEIESSRFTPHDFARFSDRLQEETALLERYFRDGLFCQEKLVAGFELEAWIVDREGLPLPENEAFLAQLNHPLVVPELAAFNIEINSTPRALTGEAFSLLFEELAATWAACCQELRRFDAEPVMIGILPSVRQEHLSLANMSDMKRYRALNDQIFSLRRGRPVKLHIKGRDELSVTHRDVMLEAAATSFQLHLQIPLAEAVRMFNAAMIAAAPVVAGSANSPYLFGRDLWSETRIPLFEQAIDVGLKGQQRVTFGSGYARDSLLECFKENLEHYAVLLPACSDEEKATLPHLRFHNGTIWRWNRPLIGVENKLPHLRIEHRSLAAGPSPVDSIANAVFAFGLIIALGRCPHAPERDLAFEVAKKNFYAAARDGLSARLCWLDGRVVMADQLILNFLLPMAADALRSVAIAEKDIQRYLTIVEARAKSGRNGAAWQRQWVARHGASSTALVKAYIANQESGLPVHEWSV